LSLKKSFPTSPGEYPSISHALRKTDHGHGENLFDNLACIDIVPWRGSMVLAIRCWKIPSVFQEVEEGLKNKELISTGNTFSTIKSEKFKFSHLPEILSHIDGV
jgi:hypothetical protein